MSVNVPKGAEQRQHPYLSGNFAPIQQTRTLSACRFEGRIPRDLAGGQYVRNGGNPLTNDDLGRDAHWFDGDGMLSGVLFRRVGDKGTEIQPEFVNQYLLTDLYYVAKTSTLISRPILPSIATLVNPLAWIFSIVWAVLRTCLISLHSHYTKQRYPIRKISVANTGVLYFDGRALATCESGPPLRFALPGLETVGWYSGRIAENETDEAAGTGFGGEGILSTMKEWTTAHPRVDPISHELLAFHSVFVQPYVYYSVVSPTSKSVKSVSSHTSAFNLPVPGVTAPKMMHDFGVSRSHTVIMDLPLHLNPLNLIRGLPVLSYDAHGKARFGVFPRYSPEKVRWFETKACVIFHTANTWTTELQTEISIHLLACRLTSASVVFSAGNLPTPDAVAVPPDYAEEEQCRLYYYQFPLPGQGGPSHIRSQWALTRIPFEFPTMSQAHSMQKARYIYGCTTSSGTYTTALGKAAKIDFLAKVNVLELIARGVSQPPQPISGCVDERTVDEILDSKNPEDPIKLFKMPQGWFAQEPRFVASRDPTSEDDGWLLTYVFDESQLDDMGECRPDAQSELWIINAKNMRDVVARVRLPQRVPYGLHGTFFTEQEVENQRPYLRHRRLE